MLFTYTLTSLLLISFSWAAPIDYDPPEYSGPAYLAHIHTRSHTVTARAAPTSTLAVGAVNFGSGTTAVIVHAAAPTSGASGPPVFPAPGAGGPAVTNPDYIKSFFSNSLITGAPAAAPGAYQCFSGPATSFPPMSQWASFEALFALNAQAMSTVDTSDQIKDIHDAIISISQASNVDARVILAVIIQESSGNVHVPCTNNGIQNCGLMQAFSGSVSFDPAQPASSITQMVRDGTQGTALGGGLVQLLDAHGNLYEALRAYNSGSVDEGNLGDGRGATASYVADVANRLLGWNGFIRGQCAF